jgi:hypothetical protein
LPIDKRHVGKTAVCANVGCSRENELPLRARSPNQPGRYFGDVLDGESELRHVDFAGR